jgi:N-acetyl-1-D-myo-inositol-2-amino-2-deoxy-alpha-D-glucopyranoside deacetylase
VTLVPRRRLLLVHAHPDDETLTTGGTIARYAAEPDTSVTVVTCTLGEQGEVIPPELALLAPDEADQLGGYRIAELNAACAALGVTDHRFLGGFGRYSDSGMAWHEDGYAVVGEDVPDNAFWNADLTEAATLLVEVIREVRPQVMTTYDQFGTYGHPDHIQAHRVATYAAFLAAVPTYRTDLGEPWEITKIYWQAMSESRWRRSLRAIRDAGDTTTFEGMDPDGPLPMATPDADLAAEIDGLAYADQKVAALHAHRTQIEVDGPFFALSNHVGNEVLGIESFRIAKGTPAPGPDRLETDLFAGI